MTRQRIRFVPDVIAVPSKRKSVKKKPAARADDGGAYFGPDKSVGYFSSGCKLLDCCLSANGLGWADCIINLVGDKAVGKTLLACEAGANYLLAHPKARVWYRDVEGRLDQNYVGSLGIPVERFQVSTSMSTVEDVFDDLLRLTSKGRCGLYIVDSLDALSDRAEQKRGFDDASYGGDKAKKMSQLFRRLKGKLDKSNIAVMFVSQIRDKIGVRFGERYSRTGGRALDFYASQIVWLAVTKTLTRTVDGVERPVGEMVRAKVKKCSVGPPFRECEFPVLFNYGVDDLMASVAWLKTVKAAREAGLDKAEVKRLTSVRCLAEMDREEYGALQARVDKQVRRVWRRIESNFAINRRKY